jgi:hypothetical protein
MRKFTFSSKVTKALVALVASTSFFYTSCTEQEENIAPNAEELVTDEVKANFKNLGFDVSDITTVPAWNPFDGSLPGYNYLLEGDIQISPETMEGMLNSKLFHLGPNGEQYRTFNLVSSPRTIRVVGYTGGSYALTSKMRTALQWAINNYNRVNIGLNFTLSFSTSTNADIVVYKISGGGGSAGFPENGNPYKWVQIGSDMEAYNTNVNEHVMTHEIGHCLGFRHTDYFNRSYSCGTGGNEGSGGVGAVHIPGTPTSYDSESIMLACFNTGVDGEFSTNDVRALEYLY